MKKNILLIAFALIQIGTPLFADEPVIIPQGEWWEDTRYIVPVHIHNPYEVINIHSYATKTIKIRVIDPDGRTVFKGLLNVTEGESYTLPLNNEKQGEYTVSIENLDSNPQK